MLLFGFTIAFHCHSDSLDVATQSHHPARYCLDSTSDVPAFQLTIGCCCHSDLPSSITAIQIHLKVQFPFGFTVSRHCHLNSIFGVVDNRIDHQVFNTVSYCHSNSLLNVVIIQSHHWVSQLLKFTIGCQCPGQSHSEIPAGINTITIHNWTSLSFRFTTRQQC